MKNNLATFFILSSAVLILVQFMSCNNSSGEVVIKDHEANEMESIQFSDESDVTVREGSKLRYPSRFVKTREVGFLGEGFFTIQSDQVPFLINVEHGQISTTGSKINLRTHARGILALKVQEGSASFTPSGGSPQQVTAGQAYIYYIHNGQNFLVPMDPENMDSWIDNVLIFNNSMVSMVVNDLNEHYDSNVQIEQDVVKNCQFTGTYRNKSLEEILEDFRNVFWLDGIDHFDTIIALRGGECRN